MKKIKSSTQKKWIIEIILLSFVISVTFSLISETAIPNVGIIIGIFICLIFIIIGIIFDMVGVSVTASDESIFHSMSSRNVKGAKMAVKLKKNASKVSSFCNDVVGDICGIISGSTGTVITLKIVEKFNFNNLSTTIIIMGIISAITIGGKAIVKEFAIKRSNEILFRFAKILNIFDRK